MNYDTSDPKVREQLGEIATYAASEEAERLLNLAKVSRVPNEPALLTLFEWAVFQAAEEYGIDPTRAEAVMDGVNMLLFQGKIRAAVLYLLNLDGEDPTETLPSPALGNAETREEAAWAAISLAD